MKICILAPPEIPIPLGDSYGGIERLAEDLAGRFVEQGDTVSVFCSKRSEEPSFIYHSYPNNFAELDLGQELTIDFTHQKVGRTVFDRHEYISIPFLTDSLSRVNDVFPTEAVREGFGEKGPVIYPGIKNRFHVGDKAKDPYVLFFGRISSIKRPDIAVKVAQKAGWKIKVAGHAGKFSMSDGNYVGGLELLIQQAKGEFIPNPTDKQKIELFADASALIMPSQWALINSKESFGITAVEALMSGTPVLCSGEGGLSEIVALPYVGAICSSMKEYIQRLQNLKIIGPRFSEACTSRGNYFDVERAAIDYLDYWNECQ